MSSFSLYAPGTAQDAPRVDDTALLGALLRAEAAWVEAQADCGLLSVAAAEGLVAALGAPEDYAVDEIAAEAAHGGNPVIPVLAAARARVAGLPDAAVREAAGAAPGAPPEAARGAGGAAGALHRGLTSQDVMDTALVLVLADAVAAVRERLDAAVEAFARLAREHRDAPCLTRTLTQPALPGTAGLRFAHWVRNLAEARAALPDPQRLPVQLGGAAGTQAALLEVLGYSCTVSGLGRAWAHRLGLAAEEAPWHTDRLRVLGWAQGLAAVSLAGSRIARDVLQGARHEVGELAEAGGGGSSAMPQKSNPTVSVLLNRTGHEAPGLLASVAAAAGQAVDERPDGAWHAEWSALARLELGALTSARLLGELAERLRVDAGRMRENLRAAGPGVVAERLVHALGPDVPRAEITRVLAGASDPAEARAQLSALVPEERRGELSDLLDPLAYTGRAGELVDVLLAESAAGSVPGSVADSVTGSAVGSVTGSAVGSATAPATDAKGTCR